MLTLRMLLPSALSMNVAGGLGIISSSSAEVWENVIVRWGQKSAVNEPVVVHHNFRVRWLKFLSD